MSSELKAYRLYTNPATLMGAVMTCSSLNGRLATATDDAEYVQITTLGKILNVCLERKALVVFEERETSQLVVG